MTWVTIDENPVSINDGWFVCDPNVDSQWFDVPATYHNGAGGVSFADGHSEIRRWKDRNVLGLTAVPGTVTRDTSTDDLDWLQDRSTSRVR
jgi:prepilin-type processing-associated H-X9-DG protein